MIFIEFALCERERASEHTSGVSLAQRMIKKYLNKDIDFENIQRGKHGKPIFDNTLGADISLSHSSGAVICALRIKGKESEPEYLKNKLQMSNHFDFSEIRKRELENTIYDLSYDKVYVIDEDLESVKVGADIELLDFKKSEEMLKRISQKYFHPSEKDRIFHGAFSRRKFFEIWVKKESRGKMLGKGLQGSLKEYNSLSDDNSCFFSFTLHKEDKEYAGAVCFEV